MADWLFLGDRTFVAALEGVDRTGTCDQRTPCEEDSSFFV